MKEYLFFSRCLLRNDRITKYVINQTALLHGEAFESSEVYDLNGQLFQELSYSDTALVTRPTIGEHRYTRNTRWPRFREPTESGTLQRADNLCN